MALTEEQKTALRLRRMKDEKILIVTNLLNGVPLWLIKQHYRMSDKEVTDLFSFVMRKVKNYLFKFSLLPVFCDTVEEAQKYKRTIFKVLPELNLEKAPVFRDIIQERVESDYVGQAFNDLRGRPR